MLQGCGQVRQSVHPWVCPAGQRSDIEAKEIMGVLRRAATDNGFIAQLTREGSKALQGYALSQQARAALLSGDIRWIEARVGRLNTHMRMWLKCRLEQEIW
jgi:hypothetical protein